MSTVRARLGTAALAAVPLAALGLFFLYPVAGMVGRGLFPDGAFAPGEVLEVLGRDRTRRVLWFTLWSSAVATTISVVLGVPIAFVLHRLRIPGRAVLRAVVLVPFVLPTVVVGVAFRRLLAPGGLLGGWGLDGTAIAIIAALAFFNVSVVVRTVGAFWDAIDPRAEEAAAALGASPRRVFTGVTLPALLPGIVSAASVVFLFCATSFGVVLTLGGLRYANVETEIYLLTQELELSGAAALSLLQLLVIVVLLVLAARVRRDPVPVSRTLRAARPVTRRHLPLLALLAVAVAFLALPVAELVLSSVRVDGHWSLAPYRALGGTGEQALLVPALVGLRNSLQIAVVATAIALGLGGIVAFLVSRPGRSKVAGAFDGLFMLPLGVSAVTLGFGFLITLDRPPIDLRSSSLLIPIAQAMVALPLVVRVLAPVLRSVDTRQREAAASLGASPWRTFLAVDVPVAWRPLLGAAGFAFAVSLGEFGATSFLARDDDPTLPVVIYRLMSHPGELNAGMAMAASVLLAGTIAVVMLLVERLRIPSVGAF